MNRAKRQTNPPVCVIVATFASLGIVLGSAGPWGSFEINTWDMDYHRVATMVAGAVAAIVLMSLLVANPRFGQPWIAIGLGALAWAVATVTIVYVEASWKPLDDQRNPTGASRPDSAGDFG